MNYQMYGQPAMMGAPSYQMRPPQQQMGPGTMPVRYSAPMQAQQPQQTPMSPATTSTTSSAPSTPAAAPVAFQLPRVSKGIKITNPDTGEAVKLPAVTVKEPAPSTPSPAPAAAVPVATAPVAAPATPTPPPAAIPTPVPTPESLEAPKTEAAARSRSISPLPATLPVRESKAIKIVRPEDAEKERKEKEAAEKEKKEKETAAPPPTPAPVAAPISVVEAEHVEPPAPEPTKEVAKTEEQPKPVDAEAPAVKSEAVVAEAGEPAASEPEASADVQGNGEEQPAKSATEPVVEVASSESVEPDSLEKKTTEEKPTEEKEAVAAEEKLAPVEAETEPAKESVSEEKPKVDEPKLPTQFVKPTSFEDVQYPDGVEAPARVNGILRYERIFLLRFKDAKDKWERPEGLPTNDVIYDDSGAARSGSSSAGRRAGSTTGLPARPGSQRPDMSNPLARAGSAGVGSSMRTSEERYAAARAGMAAAGGSFLSSFGPKPGGFTGMGPRATSAGGGALGGRAPSTSGRAAGGGRSRGGEKGGRQGSQGGKSRKDLELEAQFTIPLDQIKPLELSASAWAPPTVKKKGSDDDDEKLKRKLQGLLNKLSLEKFESISNQIMGIGIDDEASLALVIAGVFDKAVDEPNFGSMYARLCAKLSNELPKTRSWMMDEKDPSKNNLFRRLLLTKCQLEFEKGAKWSEIGKDREPKEISEMTLEEKQKVVEDEEKRQKMKRQALGNIRFIGELFNLGMLGEKIMHACIKQLLQDGAKNHGEEELESVCKLMATIGEKLDHAKAKAHMDEYFKVIKKLTTNQSLTSRIRFALQDIVDLREKYHWKARGAQAAGPKTIAEIRQAVSCFLLFTFYIAPPNCTGYLFSLYTGRTRGRRAGAKSSCSRTCRKRPRKGLLQRRRWSRWSRTIQPRRAGVLGSGSSAGSASPTNWGPQQLWQSHGLDVEQATW